jgi:hypothetical protein
MQVMSCHSVSYIIGIYQKYQGHYYSDYLPKYFECLGFGNRITVNQKCLNRIYLSLESPIID